MTNDQSKAFNIGNSTPLYILTITIVSSFEIPYLLDNNFSSFLFFVLTIWSPTSGSKLTKDPVPMPCAQSIVKGFFERDFFQMPRDSLKEISFESQGILWNQSQGILWKKSDLFSQEMLSKYMYRKYFMCMCFGLFPPVKLQSCL